jgi:hypothetical protein
VSLVSITSLAVALSHAGRAATDDRTDTFAGRFLGVVVGYSLKILDGVEAGLHDIPVKRSLEGVPVRKNGQELVYVVNMRGQLFGRAPQLHALERQDAVRYMSFRSSSGRRATR